MTQLYVKSRRLQLAVLFLLVALILPACGKQSSSVPTIVSALPASSAAPVEPMIHSSPEGSSLLQIDFTAMQQKNADIIGWVEVPGTNISYPVLRTTDNAFYLTHNEWKTYDKNGAIFIDMSNASDFSSPVTVAYGHYTPEQSHFTQLHLFKDSAFFQENRIARVYHPGAVISYEIVAAFTTGSNNLLYEKDYSKTTEMQHFIDWMTETPAKDANLALTGATASSRYLVLSTCVQEFGGDNRYIVVARQVEVSPVT